MSDLAVSIGVGATMEGSVRAVVGSTVRHLDRLRQSTKTLGTRAAGVGAFRALRSDLRQTETALGAARAKTAELGGALKRTAAPTREMREAFEKARTESDRLERQVEEKRGELGRLGGALRKAGINTDRLDQAEKRLNRTLARQERQLRQVGSAMEARDRARARRAERRGQVFEAVAVGAAVVAPIVKATQAAVEFESKMADVRKVVDFDSPQQFADMGRDILALSERIPVAASGIGDIVAAAGQAGIAREELTRFAEDAAKVAVAFDISGGEAGGRLTGLRSIFKLNQDDVMALAGSYNELSNGMDATASDILNIAERAGSMAAQFGLTGEQVGALGATFLELKTPPEVAGTAINAMLTKLGTAPQQGKKFQEALEEIGLDAELLKERIGEDAQGALLDFLDAIDTADDKSAVLFNLFGQEYVDDITKLVGGIDNYRNALKLSSDEAAAASSIQAEYEARAATTENSLQLLRNRFYRLGISVGNVVLPALNDGVGAIGSVVGKAVDLAERFPGATRAVIGLAGGLIALKLTSAVGGYAATFFAQGWHAGRIAMLRARGGAWALGGAISRLSLQPIPLAIGALKLFRLALIGTGIGAAVVAIGAGAALIMRYWEPIKAFFAGFGRGLSVAFEPVAPVFGWVGEMVRWLGDAFVALSRPVDATAETLEGFGAKGEAAGRVVGAIFNALLAPVKAVADGVGWVLESLGLVADEAPRVGAAAEKKLGFFASWFGGEEEADEDAPPGPSSPPGPGPATGAVAAALVATAAPVAAVEYGPPGAATAPTAPVVALAPVVPAPAPPPPPVPLAAPSAPFTPVVDAGAVADQVRGELATITAGVESPVPGGEDAGVFERIEADLGALAEGVEPGELAPAEAPLGAFPAPAREVSLVFHQTFHFNGADGDLPDQVEREMERVMRRAAVEAGLGESDDVF